MTDSFDDISNEPWIKAWVVVMALINGSAQRRFSATQRKQARQRLRVAFEDKALRNAQRLISGQLTPPDWFSTVQDDVVSYTRQMAAAGAGDLPDVSVRQRAVQILTDLMPYLATFATVAATMSIRSIAARTRQYGGVGWAMFFVGQGSIVTDFTVERWVSRDDARTCRNCASYSGTYYLPMNGPMPGLDCAAAGHCRCFRQQTQDEQIWRRLSGRHS